MQECISIHIGQAGVQMGEAYWELLCLEHGVQPDGSLTADDETTHHSQKTPSDVNCSEQTPINSDNKPMTDNNNKLTADNNSNPFLQTCFSETESTNKYVPRALFVDLEPTCVDQLRRGPYRELYSADQLLTGKEDAANNFTRGYFCSRDVCEEARNKVRKMAEQCSSLQGFLLFNALGGGTGSGFSTLLVERLGAEYKHNRSKVEFTVYPSPNYATNCVEPYNAVLSCESKVHHSDAVFMFDNEALYDVCRLQDMERPTYVDLNRLIAQVASSVTSSIRFGGALHADLTQLFTNLMPYPKIHFLAAALAPVLPVDQASQEHTSVVDITKACFRRSNQMVSCHPMQGKYMSCCTMYRGDVACPDLCSAIQEIKTNPDIRFVDWCPTGFKTGVCSRPPKVVPGSGMAEAKRSVCMLSNNTSVKDVFTHINQKFDRLYRKRAFVHWFVGIGIEDSTFDYARQHSASLVQDYEEIHNYDATAEGNGGEDDEY